MTDPVDIFLDSLKPMLMVVNEILDARTDEGCMQVPSLLLTLAGRLNWSDKQIRANDPLIRAYIKTHQTWDITRGAHGGIVRRASQDKKRAALVAKQKAKAEIEAILNAQVASVPATPSDLT
jgi:hypothetical protein